MSINSDIKVWKLEPGLSGYTPGMDLGEPDEVHEPTSVIVPSTRKLSSMSTQAERSRRGVANRKPRKSKSLTKEVYEQHIADGMTILQISEKYDIKSRTLQRYVSDWKKVAQS